MLLVVAAAHAACPADPADLARAAEIAARTGEGGTQVLADVSCVSGPITPEAAVWIHRVAAQTRWAMRDLAGTTAHLRAVRSDTSWDPPDADLQRLVAAQRGVPAGPFEPLVSPTGWDAWIDGIPSDRRPTDRAALLQWLGPDGAPRATALLSPGDPLPRPPVAATTLGAVPKGDPWLSEPGNRALAGGIGLGALAVGLVAAGLAVRADLPDAPPGAPDPQHARDVRRTARTANALGLAGQGVGLAAIGLVVTSRVAF